MPERGYAHGGTDLTEYERGYLDGLWAYAWWKDGTAYVGTTGRTYKRAVEAFLAEHGKTGWTVTYERDAPRPSEAT